MSLWMKSESVTIQMKATEQYFPLVPSIFYFSSDTIRNLMFRFD